MSEIDQETIDRWARSFCNRESCGTDERKFDGGNEHLRNKWRGFVRKLIEVSTVVVRSELSRHDEQLSPREILGDPKRRVEQPMEGDLEVKLNTYVCRGVLHKEQDGGWSALCTNLPGCVSQGETIDEAKRNLAEAFQGVCESYLEDGERIPFNDSPVERVEIPVSLSVPLESDSAKVSTSQSVRAAEAKVVEARIKEGDVVTIDGDATETYYRVERVDEHTCLLSDANENRGTVATETLRKRHRTWPAPPVAPAAEDAATPDLDSLEAYLMDRVNHPATLEGELASELLAAVRELAALRAKLEASELAHATDHRGMELTKAEADRDRWRQRCEKLERAAGDPPIQPIVKDGGVLRFRENAIVRALLETSKLDLNNIAAMSFSVEDREQFHMLIGYSLSGFDELSDLRDETCERAKEVAALLAADGGSDGK